MRVSFNPACSSCFFDAKLRAVEGGKICRVSLRLCCTRFQCVTLEASGASNYFSTRCTPSAYELCVRSSALRAVFPALEIASISSVHSPTSCSPAVVRTDLHHDAQSIFFRRNFNVKCETLVKSVVHCCMTSPSVDRMSELMCEQIG